MTSLGMSAPPVVAAVSRAGAALAEAASAPLWSLGDAELAELVVAAGRVVAAAQGVLLRLVGEADARAALVAGGATSSAAFLRERLRLSPAEAASCAKTARAMRTMAETGAACAAGRITGGQAAAITRAVSELPGGVRAEAERTLLAQAAVHDPVVLGRLGRRIAAHVDPDAEDGQALARAEERAERRVELCWSPDGEGGSWLRGRLDAEGTAVVRAALDPLSAPRPSTAEGPDPRSAGRRRGEALVEVCRRVLAGGQLPASGGDRPLVVVTVPLATLTGRVGAGMLDDGTPISPVAARRLACDAAVLPAVLGGAGQPLDLGRARRLFTGPVRRALVLRDRGCAFPGCDRPPGWCEAHHIRHWADGGPTSVANGVLLCGAHHRLVERGEWEVRLAADDRPDFHPHPGSTRAGVPAATTSTTIRTDRAERRREPGSAQERRRGVTRESSEVLTAAAAGDAVLIERSWREPEGFAELFDRHAPAVHRYLARRLGEQVAGDVLAETFLAAFRRRERYDLSRPDARPWLYGIATTLVGQHRRDEARRHRLLRALGPEPDTPFPADGIADRVSAAAARRALVDALAALAPADRDVLLLAGAEQLTYEEVATALDIPVGTVRSRLHRARRQMRAALGDTDPTDPEEPR